MNRKINNTGGRRFNFPNRYNEHDDRTNNSENHIRKVSFKNNYGRIGKKKTFGEVGVRRLRMYDDVEMSNGEPSGQRKGFNSNRINRGNFKNRPDTPGVRYQNIRPLRRTDSYEVKVPYGSKLEKESLLKLIHRQIAPQTFTPTSYEVIGNDVVFYVDNISVANKLQRADRKILLNDGHYMIIRVSERRATPVDTNVKEKMKLVMAGRYIAENKALNLSGFCKDPGFNNGVYCPLSSPAHLAAAMQIISENIIDLAALNLNSNGIYTFSENTCNEFRKLKNLKILHLEDNSLKSIHALNGLQDLEITEIILKKNPVCNNYKDPTHFVSEVRNRFPKLEKLDDVVLPKVISFDVGEEAKLPSPTSSYFCELQGQDIVKAFIKEYFQIYDSGSRQNLEQAYHSNAFFSQCAFYPPQNNSGSGKSLNTYIQESRNLLKVSDYPRRKKLLRIGKENIVQCLVQLPKTQHDLSSFTVDLVKFTPELMNLTVCGIFREPNASDIETTWPVRYFCRTFLIVPFGQGFCIVNDLFVITNASDTQIVTAFKKEQGSTVILQSPQAAPLPAAASPALDNSVRQQMVEALAARTGMNFNYSTQCLDASQWNFDQAVWTFEEHKKKGGIPPEAFTV